MHRPAAEQMDVDVEDRLSVVRAKAAPKRHWQLIAWLASLVAVSFGESDDRGQCQLIFDPRHVARVDELTAGWWQAMTEDLFRARRA